MPALKGGNKMDAKAFRNAVNSVKSTLDDKTLFLSNGFRTVCNNIITGVSKAWNQKITVLLEWGNPKGAVAYATENNVVYLNLNNEMVQNTTRHKRYRLYIALLLHECGHRLFTDFSDIKRRKNMVINEHLLSYTGCEEANEYLYAHPEDAVKMANALFKFINRIEDGHIELRLLDRFHGYGRYLQELRDMQLEGFPSLEEMREKNIPSAACLFNMVLCYAKYHVMLSDESSQDEVSKMMYEIAEYIDLARVEKNAKTRNQLICEAFNFLFSLLIQKKENEQSQSNSGNPSPTQQQNNSSQDDSGDESEDSTGNDPKNSTDTESEDSESDNSGASGNDSSDESDNESEDNSSTTNSQSDDSETSEDESDELGDNASTTPSLSDELESILSNVSEDQEEENGSTPSTSPLVQEHGQIGNTNDQSASTANSNENEDTGDDSREISSLEESVAEEKVIQEEEKQLTKLLNTLKNEMDFGEYHRYKNRRGQWVDITCDIKRVSPIPSEDYDSLKEQTATAMRRMVKEFQKEIRDMQLGDRLTGLYSGQRVYQPYRQDLRRFSKNRAPEDIPNMSLILLIDESGSMDGERIEAARKTALLIYEFCAALKIRVSIYGHGADMEGGTFLHCYAEFDSIDRKDAYRISNIKAENACNRDGYALRFCSEKLLKETSDQRILMIISDGAPNDINYGYHYIPENRRTSTFHPEMQGNAKMDIADVLKTYGKKGISFITAGLGDDIEPIKDIYCDMDKKFAAKFLSITDLDAMPKKMVSILKSLIK